MIKCIIIKDYILYDIQLKTGNYIIYKVTHLPTNRVYIGQTTKTLEERKYYHLYDSKKLNKTKFHRALNKYPDIEWKWNIIDFANSKDELNFREKFWIMVYDSTNQNKGFNLTLGGESSPMLSEETRKKQSISQIKRFQDPIKKQNFIDIMNSPAVVEKRKLFLNRPEVKEKNSKRMLGDKNPFAGKTHTEKTKQIISKTQKGKKLSDEHKKIISINMTGSKNPRSRRVLDTTTGIGYSTLKETASKCDVSTFTILRHCQCKVKIPRWKYIL